MNQTETVILASSSPRRQELMKLLDIPFLADRPCREETCSAVLPWEIVKELSSRKAEEVASRHPGSLVIGADTVVSFNQNIFGKPGNEQKAFEMLWMIQGQIHQVYTGVTLFFFENETNSKKYSFYCKTDVEVYPMTEREIRDYISTGEPFDKAGGYGIQGVFCRYVKGITGDYQNVVGLPASRLYRELKELKTSGWKSEFD